MALPVLAYLIIALTPLGLCAVQPMSGRGFAVNLSVALGFLALSVLGLQTLVGARLPWMTRRFGSDGVGRFHRHIALLAVVAALGHPAILFLVGDGYRPLLDVAHSPLRAQLGWLSVAALVVLVLVTAARRLVRLPYPAWHVLHSLLATVVVLAALAHALLVDRYTSIPAVRGVWIGYGAVYLWLTLYIRLIRPIRLWRHPWVVRGLHPEPGDSVTVTLQPSGKRHAHRAHQAAHTWRAGQFAWLLTGRSPFSLSYHPFSLSSSADARGRLEFTIKRVGDFTGSMRALHVGDVVYLDGPHGAFTIDRTPGPGFVFLAAGVGVTPFLSMLATLADRKDKRPCLLLLGNRFELAITGVRQLRGLANRLDLTVAHVISRPSPTWGGERGRITTSLLRFYLPTGFRELEFFVCASPRTAAAYRHSLRELGVPASHIHSEQF
jgi:predicted ferric reductase